MSTYTRIGSIVVLFLIVGLAARVAAEASSCGSAAYHAFDFTLGAWNVADPKGNSRGTATVKYALDECAVVESWTAPDGHRGTNIDAFSSDDMRWHRFFVDNKGHVHVFDGTAANGLIRYTGTSTGSKGQPVLNRLLIRAERSGTMLQTWQQSNDRGRTWIVIFSDFYTPAKG